MESLAGAPLTDPHNQTVINFPMAACHQEYTNRDKAPEIQIQDSVSNFDTNLSFDPSSFPL